MVETWDVTSPAGTQAVSLGDDRIRELKRALVERLTVDHQIVTDETGLTNIGYHKQITLIEAADIGAGATGLPILGAQTVNGKPELTFTSEDDSDVQMTDSDTTLGCKILGDNVRLKNNTNLTAKNAAGAAVVNLIKANASDKVEIPDGAVMATSAAPTVDAGISNKKYVDDSQKIVQVVNTQTGAVATGTTAIPFDDTIPQNTEGDEYMTLAITPTSATSKLKIEVRVNGASALGYQVACALFQDSVASALAVSTAMRVATVNDTFQFVLTHYMTAGTTSATTFKVRIGCSTSTTFTLNGASGSRLFGGVMASSITITEIKV